MKKLLKARMVLSMFTVMIIISSFVVAQPRDMKRPVLPNDEQITLMVEDMAKQLSLNETQKEEILSLHKEHFQKLREMMKAAKGEKKVMKEEHEKLKMQLENDVKSLINDEQIKKYDEFLKKMEARRNKDIQPRDKKH